MIVTCSGVLFSEASPENIPSYGKQATSENFDKTKADALQSIGERIKKLTAEKSCVEAATNVDELRKCRFGGPLLKRIEPNR